MIDPAKLNRAETPQEKRLLNLIRRRGGRISVRQLMIAGARFRRPGVARAALDNLVQAGRGQFQVRRTRGRTANEFVLWSASVGAPTEVVKSANESEQSKRCEIVGASQCANGSEQRKPGEIVGAEYVGGML